MVPLEAFPVVGMGQWFCKQKGHWAAGSLDHGKGFPATSELYFFEGVEPT